MPKIEHENQFSTWFKGKNSKLIWRNLPYYNSTPLLPNINSQTKSEENRSKMFKIESGNEVVTDGGRTHNANYWTEGIT